MSLSLKDVSFCLKDFWLIIEDYVRKNNFIKLYIKKVYHIYDILQYEGEGNL